MKKSVLMTTVVNIKKGVEYDVYIGRPSKWGNPFRLADFGNDRDLVVKKYREWFFAPKQWQLRDAAKKELGGGKRLGCYCAPESCHGQILADFVNEEV